VVLVNLCEIFLSVLLTRFNHVQVTKEQFDIYCNIDSTFEMCKICDANLKSIRIDPCGHLMCKKCLTQWIEAGGGKQADVSCPFCRNPVLSTSSIIVEPFKPINSPSSSTAGTAAAANAVVSPAVASKLALPPSRDDDSESDSDDDDSSVFEVCYARDRLGSYCFC
jgi:hypothetical protein